MVTWKAKNPDFTREQEEGQRRFCLLKIKSKRPYGLTPRLFTFPGNMGFRYHVWIVVNGARSDKEH